MSLIMWFFPLTEEVCAVSVNPCRFTTADSDLILEDYDLPKNYFPSFYPVTVLC